MGPPYMADMGTMPVLLNGHGRAEQSNNASLNLLLSKRLT